jgi:acetyltransferase-like isoleucine patch superfamily enzyme
MLKNLFKFLVSNLYILKIRFFAIFLGVEYVVRQLESCHKFFVPILLMNYGAKLGKKIHFKGYYRIDNVTGDESATNDFSNLSIGDRCVIGKGVFFDLVDKIYLEKEVGIGAHSMLMTHMDLGQMPMSALYPRETGPIIIREGTFLGAHVLVLHGVEIGRCCIVAAGSVVTQSFPDYSLIAGVPARLIRTIEH